jgi:hypothetical protein
MAFEAMPLFLGKFHTLPVIKPRVILEAEFNAPGFTESAFCRSNMGLKFHSIGTTIGDGIYEGMCCSEAAIVCLGDFCHDQTRLAGTDRFFSNFKFL